MKNVVLISGKMGSGKTTLANKLGEIFRSDVRVSFLNFADVLYQIHDQARSTLVDLDIPIDMSKKDGNLLQLLGTEWGRNTIDPDIWVKVLLSRIKLVTDAHPAPRLIIVADCRFKNEMAAFPDAFKIRLQCDRNIRKERVSMWRDRESHPSEVDLDGQIDQFDLVLDSGDLGIDECVKQSVEKIKTYLNRGQNG